MSGAGDPNEKIDDDELEAGRSVLPASNEDFNDFILSMIIRLIGGIFAIAMFINMFVSIWNFDPTKFSIVQYISLLGSLAVIWTGTKFYAIQQEQHDIRWLDASFFSAFWLISTAFYIFVFTLSSELILTNEIDLFYSRGGGINLNSLHLFAILLFFVAIILSIFYTTHFDAIGRKIYAIPVIVFLFWNIWKNFDPEAMYRTILTIDNLSSLHFLASEIIFIYGTTFFFAFWLAKSRNN